jgi:hypothetical protein
MSSLSSGEITVHEMGVMMEETIADPIAVEQLSQEEWQGVTHRASLASELAKTNSESLNLAVVRDEFNANTFDENLDNEQRVEKIDELGSSESDEENMQPSFDIAPSAPVGPGGKGNEANVPSLAVTLCDVPTSSYIDWGSYYIDEDLRALKLKHINLQSYPNHKDISHIGSTVCDSAVIDDEENPRVREEVIKKGQLFESLDTVKFFFKDYAVHHHRPFYVAKSNKDVCYIIRCQILSCSLGVWLRCTKNEIHQWKVSKVKQYHNCGTSEVRRVHSQCMARFLCCRVMSILWADSDITVATLTEVIHDLTTYQVHYDKACRVKEHTLALLWGDWREAYTKVPRLLNAMPHFKPGTRCVINTCGQWLPNEKG